MVLKGISIIFSGVVGIVTLVDLRAEELDLRLCEQNERKNPVKYLCVKIRHS